MKIILGLLALTFVVFFGSTDFGGRGGGSDGPGSDSGVPGGGPGGPWVVNECYWVQRHSTL